jgi:hypothetical protein
MSFINKRKRAELSYCEYIRYFHTYYCLLKFVILHTISISLIYIQVNLVAKNPLQKRNLGAKRVEKKKVNM